MPENRKRIWLAVKTLLALALILLVARQFWLILRRDDFRNYPLELRWEWLVPAGLLYLGAHTLWGSFWVRLLRSEGMPVGFGVGLRAYFISQFGKYVPGKVAVIVMRTEMLRPFGCPRVPVAVTATLETLTSMAAGSLLALAFLPYLGALPEVVSKSVVWIAALAGLPVGVVLLNKIYARVASRSLMPDRKPLPIPPLTLLLQGLLQGACGWCLLGLSLGCTIRAVAPQPVEWSGPGFLGDLAAIALAYVAGFVIPTPGGLGGREFVLQEALSLRFAQVFTLVEAQAMGLSVIVALVLRLTWTAAEALLGLGLFLWKPRVPAPSSGSDESHG